MLNRYDDLIIEMIKNGYTQSNISRKIKDIGYSCTDGNVRQYICKIAKRYALDIVKYNNCISSDGYRLNEEADYVTRKGIFNHIWMNIKLTIKHHDYLLEKYPVLCEVELCVRQFKRILRKHK